MEKCEVKRAVFRGIVDNLPIERLYYIDECGINQYLYREYGYTLKGQPIIGNIKGSKFER